MMGVGVTSLLLILGVFCSASWADRSLSDTRECMRREWRECFAPVWDAYSGMTAPEIFNQIVNNDLSQTCGHVMAVRDCVQNIMTECQVFDSEDPGLREIVRMFRMADGAINYVCVDHIDVFNENKACLLRMGSGPFQVPQIILYVAAECEIPHGGLSAPFCIPASFPDCASGVVGQHCGAEIANVLRGLGQQIAGDLGTCEGHRLFKLMKKKEMKNKEMKKVQMKKKEMFSPLELMHKAFPSLF